MLVGAHMSCAGGICTSLTRAASIGIPTMQIFTKNQNRWQQKPTPPAEVQRWFAMRSELCIEPVVAHAAYLINLGTPEAELWEKSIAAMIDELARAEELAILGVVLHPGGHMGSGEEPGIARVAEALDRCHAATPGYKTLTMLENTAGQGTALGHSFEQLRAVLERVREPARLAFCLDTCHLLAAGYDLRTPESYAGTMEECARLLGLARVRCLHLNDSKKGLGSRVDRHEHIGSGQLGLEPFRLILNDPRLAEVPKILETPKSEDMHEDVENLRILRGLVPQMADLA